MTPTRQKLRLGKMPAGIGPAYRQWVENALRKIATLAGAQVLIEGATQSSVGVDGEQYIKVPTNAATCEYNWYPTKVGNSGGYDLVVLNPGTISPIPSTYGGVTIGAGTDLLTADPQPQLQIPDTTDLVSVVYLKLAVSRVTSDGFTSAATISVANILVGAALPTNTNTERYIELWRWKNGQLLYSPNIKHNMALICRGVENSETWTVLYAAA